MKADIEHGLKTTVLTGFSDPRVGRDAWNAMATRGSPGSVFSTHEWSSAWWSTYGRGRLLLIAAERNDEIIAIAPFFIDERMVYLVGAGGSDYLDLIGAPDRHTVSALLERAFAAEPDLLGMQMHLVPDSSSTGSSLSEAAAALGITLYDEGDLVAPRLDLASDPTIVEAALRKKSLVRHENHFRRTGELRTVHSRDSEEILEQLDPFFEQHVERWSGTPNPSLFTEDAHRRFYRTLVEEARDAGWLRFTRVEWDGRPIAFHLGFCHDGTYLWYKPSFAIDLARNSPGEVLLKHLLHAAVEEGAATFDFGIGDETFKRRFATEILSVRTWGLYPKGASG